MFSQIFVYYPRGRRTGGPEALHQLVHSLRQQGADAFLVPYPETANEPRVVDYARYDAPERAVAVDLPGNAIVAPEGQLVWLLSHRRAELFCWWLSIDSSDLFRPERHKLQRAFERPRAPGVDPLIRGALRLISSHQRSLIRGRAVTHLTQSQYAWSYLSTRFAEPPSMLSDYILMPSEVIDARPRNALDHQARIAFPWAKARHITEEVSRLVDGATFLPLVGMTPGEVRSALASTDVYLDLGPHPGRDRTPREAAMSGAVVIVAARGSASFTDDVDIPDCHKLLPDSRLAARAAAMCQKVLSRVEDEFDSQASYRRTIADEIDVFVSDVESIFFEGRRGLDTPASRAIARQRKRERGAGA